mmetsp:Transcript_38262/g.90341  ORF Transcript_38262/g.90341 Transcript_38262/m.90341 type:complete len:235 (+) Transcript_38262:273-977(+)
MNCSGTFRRIRSCVIPRNRNCPCCIAGSRTISRLGQCVCLLLKREGDGDATSELTGTAIVTSCSLGWRVTFNSPPSSTSARGRLYTSAQHDGRLVCKSAALSLPGTVLTSSKVPRSGLSVSQFKRRSQFTASSTVALLVLSFRTFSNSSGLLASIHLEGAGASRKSASACLSKSLLALLTMHSSSAILASYLSTHDFPASEPRPSRSASVQQSRRARNRKTANFSRYLLGPTRK